MKGDPKDPNAWWAVKLPFMLPVWMMEDIRKAPKRLYWLVPLAAALAFAEILGLYKMGLLSN